MKFKYLVALTASTMLVCNSWADEIVAPAGDAEAKSGVVILNTNTNTNTNTNPQTVVQQPVTNVEANPVVESKAEMIRKARQNAEVQTEQKIVEKLEESRLQEEQRRAERLFGDRLNDSSASAAQNSAPVVVAPIVQQVEQKKEEPTVVIEKVEIVQPAPAPAPIIEKIEPAPAVIVTEAPKEEHKRKWYIGGTLGAGEYDADNVSSSYAAGIVVGTLTHERILVEGFWTYSSYDVDTYWQDPLYRELTQNDFGVAAKYSFLSGSLKPYVGGQIAYVYRKYTDRIKDGYAYWYNDDSNEETTSAVDLGLNVGLDFEVSHNFMIGAEYKYNWNFISKNDINYAEYGVPENTRPLEELDHSLFQITAKMSF